MATKEDLDNIIKEALAGKAIPKVPKDPEPLVDKAKAVEDHLNPSPPKEPSTPPPSPTT